MDPTDTAFQFAPGDTAWIICAMALVWLMIPGLAYFYSGLSRSKNALTMMMASFICLMVASIQVRRDMAHSLTPRPPPPN